MRNQHDLIYVFANCRKEKEYEDAMNHLQKDIDSLESERHHLRENLKAHSAKKGDVKQPITFGKSLKVYSNKMGAWNLRRCRVLNINSSEISQNQRLPLHL